jgi:hypothetical protein
VSAVLFCRNYAELNAATTIVGTILAHSYITMTGASVHGATISLGAAVTLTGSSVRLPSAAALVLSQVVVPSISAPAVYQTPVNLGRAHSFAVIGGSTLTNTGASVISGDVGSYPGAEAAGGPVGTGATLHGIDYAASGVTAGAQTDLLGVYADLTARAYAGTSTGIASSLSQLTLIPGVYFSTNDYLTLDGTLTFDAQGDPDAVFVIIAPGAGYLAVSPGAQMVLLNGCKASNIFWALGAYFAAGPGSVSVGTFVASSYVALTSASVIGAVFSMHAAATLTTSSVRLPNIAALTAGAAYTTSVDMMGAASFAVMGGDAIVNTVSADETCILCSSPLHVLVYFIAGP